MVLTQSLQHRDLAKRVGPLLKEGQIVFLIPGNMGSTQFAAYTEGKHVIYVEGESTPYDARIIAPGKVEILFKNVRNAVSFLHKEDEIYLPAVTSLFGTHKYLRSNIVESTMHNPNMIVHTVGSIMSASRIENAPTVNSGCTGKLFPLPSGASSKNWTRKRNRSSGPTAENT